MRSLDLAARVLMWAADPRGAPPRGDPSELGSLGELDERTREALRTLAARAGASLRLDHPPLGDARPLGPGAVWMAAAVGAAHTAVATGILEAAPAPLGAWDLVARFGLAAPALPQVPELVAEGLRRASPLIGLLERPADGEADAALALASQLRGRTDGARLLMRALSTPHDETRVLRWRADLLERTRTKDEVGRAFVLDVYEAAVFHHAAAWTAAVEQSVAALADPRCPEPALQRALAMARLWEPLRRVHRGQHDELRERPLLDFYVYLPALRLAELGARMEAR